MPLWSHSHYSILSDTPHLPDEPVPRDDMVSMNKLMAKGSPSKQQIMLGLFVDTRRLLVSLPLDKNEVWLSQINDTLFDGSVNPREL